MGGQVVDTQSAEEFMRETLENVSRDELLSVAERCSTPRPRGSAPCSAAPGQARTLDRDDLRRVLRSIFATRRKADTILDDVGPARLGAAIDDLLHGSGVVTERFVAFDRVLPGPSGPGLRPAVGAAALHRSPTGGGCGPAGCGTPGPAPAPWRW